MLRHALLATTLVFFGFLVPMVHAKAADVMTTPVERPQQPGDDGKKAETAHKPQYFTVSRTARHGLFLAPHIKYSSLVGRDTLLLGGRGGWQPNEHLAFGIAAYTTPNRLTTPRRLATAKQPTQLRFRYAGGLVESSLWSQHRLHAMVGLLGGVGRISLYQSGGHNAARTDTVLVLEPEIHLQLRLNQHATIAAGVTYRHVMGIGLPGALRTDFSGPAGSLLLRFKTF